MRHLKGQRAKRQKTKIINLEPFNYEVIIVLTDDVQESAGQIAHAHGHDDDEWETDAMHVHPHGRALSYLFLPFDATASMIAHEAFHCVWRVMKFIGAEFENEVMAYTLGFLVGEVCEFASAAKKGR